MLRRVLACNNRVIISRNSSRLISPFTTGRNFSTAIRVNGAAASHSGDKVAVPAHNNGEHDHHDEHHHHEEHYTDNDGRLFNVPLGQEYQNQGWEYGHYFLFIGSLVVLIVALNIKPDYSIAAWADEEFLRRKQAREQREKSNQL